MKIKMLTLFMFLLSSLVFSDFLYENSLEFSFSLYRFSYSEEFDDLSGFTIGLPRSDEYGPTIGAEIGYNRINKENKLSFGVNFNYSRSIVHTYDGSYQGQPLYFGSDTIWFYQPYKDDNKNNFFYSTSIKLGYLKPVKTSNGQAVFEPKFTGKFNIWDRPVGSITEYYFWARFCPGISLTTINSTTKLGITSGLSLSIPVWQKMYLRWWNNERFRFDIGGKVGWQFDLGLVRYLENKTTVKIVYFHENYGFKKSPTIQLDRNTWAYEPASSTFNNGVKISIVKGFGT